MSNQLFENLFVLDVANNHQGITDHGKKIIQEAAKLAKKHKMKVGIKFQYRQLDTFIHPSFKEKKDIKHIPHFIETGLSREEFKELVDEVKRNELITICTPFDEESVDVIQDHGIEIIKVASCSARDWSLLEKIVDAGKPIICSTGGLNIEQLDSLISFFTHRNAAFALMHCVAIYPTENEDLSLNRIDFLKKRYPFIPIGFSTHEHPDNTDAVKMAVAKGALILERHIGLETDQIKLNKYSSTPQQLENWFVSAKKAYDACQMKPISEKELQSLGSLQRGVYAKMRLKKGQEITKNDVFFAMPLQKNQIPSGNFKSGLKTYDGKLGANLKANRDYELNEPIDDQKIVDVDQMIFTTIHKVKGLLYEARIAIGDKFKVELSHHYRIERFNEVGAVIIDVINREYCKKLIVQVPGQYHPNHYHKIKEETFQVLYGDLVIDYDGEEYCLMAGDQLTIEREKPHSFTTKTGVVVEEISTTHVKNDSFYLDENIAKEVEQRKTKFNLW